MNLTAEKTTPTDKELFLAQLRKQTAYWHQQLEQTDISIRLLDDNVSIDNYKLYLCKMYGFVKPFEATVFPRLQEILPDISARKKTSLLANDLIKIGMSVDEINALPIFVFDKNWHGPEAMGAMYVMEGSTLGGVVIYKHISKILGLTNERGASYFFGYGNTTGSNWKTFVNTLTQYATENNVGQQLTNSAENTFENIYNWFAHQ